MRLPTLSVLFAVTLAVACGGSEAPQGAASSAAVPDISALEPKCDEGDAAACTALVAAYQARCDENDFRSCNGLARMHFDGAFATQDRDKAIELWDKACSGGYQAGCQNLNLLARIYAEGDGLPADAAKAAMLYEKACRAGVAEACEAIK